MPMGDSVADLKKRQVEAQLSGTTLQTQPVSGTVVASTAAGSPISVVSAATTNFAVLRNAAASLFELSASNPTATPAFVKLYNKATTPTVADVPVLTIEVLAGKTVPLEFGRIGKRFAAGISIGITGAVAANDATIAPVGVQVHGTYI